MEANLAEVPNSHVKPLRVTALSKQGWTPQVASKYKEFNWTLPLYQQKRTSRFTLKAARNSYYYTVG